MQFDYKYESYNGDLTESFSITEAGRTWSVKTTDVGECEVQFECEVCVPKRPSASVEASTYSLYSYEDLFKPVLEFFDFLYLKVLFFRPGVIRKPITEVNIHVESYFDHDVVEEIKKLYSLLSGENADVETDIRALSVLYRKKTGKELDIQKCLAEFMAIKDDSRYCYREKLVMSCTPEGYDEYETL